MLQLGRTWLSTEEERSTPSVEQAVCARGYLYDAVSAGCAPCPAGSYNNVANAAECLPCAAGFYAAAPASTACTQCPSFSTTPTQVRLTQASA